MSFDKIKAMRSAEKFMSQGKIRAAINEYKRITESDPRDFNTLNTLGDLYVKNSDEREAVGCYKLVAEHYNNQGFAHKAIAIYNKISRLEPDSAEISEKLAHLYQMKGSVAEARSHYKKLAEKYEKSGDKLKALEIWKKIADLDPDNIEFLLMIAEASKQENMKDEAVDAYVEAGIRFNKKENYESALEAFSKALEVRQHDLRALNGIVKAQINLGCADEAAENLQSILQEQPYNRDILHLLIECQMDMNDPKAAEQSVINLVEQEPANYPKFLDLVKIYLKENDLDSAARILLMSSEHLLVGGQSEDFLDWTNEILARNPEQLDALQLLVRYNNWQRDEAGLKESLERLAESARLGDLPEIEKNALMQLILISPHETSYPERMQELKNLYGFEDEIPQSAEQTQKVSDFETFSSDENNQNEETEQFVEDFEKFRGEFKYDESDGAYDVETDNIIAETDLETNAEFEFHNQDVEAEMFGDAENSSEDSPPSENEESALPMSEQIKLEKEIDSIEFYIEQGYTDLAVKSLDALEEEFGNRFVINKLRGKLSDSPAEASNEKPVSAEESFEDSETPIAFEVEVLNSEISEEFVSTAEIVTSENRQNAENSIQFNDLRSELGLDELNSEQEQGDYETHYHLAVAYQEMGLLEDAIREYQDAINSVQVNDGTRRFFRCSNLLGHCFVEKKMPTIAIMWFKRTLETEDLSNEEKQGVWYEIANAYEMGGDKEKALEYFEKIYAFDVDYRDITARIEKLNGE